MRNNLNLGFLRIIALVAVLVGAGVSLGLVLRAGHNNKSNLLITLFVIWVLSPFMALLVVNVVSKSWSVFMRLNLYILMLILPLGSWVGYSGALNSPRMKPAFIFLIVPFISWLLMGIVIPLAALLSRRMSQRSDRV